MVGLMKYTHWLVDIFSIKETQEEFFLETVQLKPISRHNQKTDSMAQLVI
jgi:hypothetical protein